jgi:hypothetical protein
MKKILLTLLFGVISYMGYSQYTPTQTDFPRYLINGKDTIGVVISVQQARKIDNDYDLIILLKKYKSQCDSTDSAYVSVVDNQNNQIALLNVKISELQSIDSTQTVMINNLNSQINDYKKTIDLSNQQFAAQTQIVNNQNKEIRKLKTQKFLGYTIGGGLALSAILILLLHH